MVIIHRRVYTCGVGSCFQELQPEYGQCSKEKHWTNDVDTRVTANYDVEQTIATGSNQKTLLASAWQQYKICDVYLWITIDYRLFQSVVRKGTNFDRSFLLKPVVLEEIIGIASTDEALMVSSPRPSDMEHADFAFNNTRLALTFTEVTKELVSSTSVSSICIFPVLFVSMTGS
uniref:Uncharacterized protein n=1 Tax=Arundo donax TaxID=35708 RepID=A0A0A9GF00_ARUDO